MNSAFIFLEVGNLSGLFFTIILIALAIGAFMSVIITFVKFMIDSSKNHQQSFQYYVIFFLITYLIVLLCSGIICGVGFN